MKAQNQNGIKKRKMVTAREVQQEYLDMDIRKVRIFLNQFCTYKKIGKTYYYPRAEVENLLLDEEYSTEYDIGAY